MIIKRRWMTLETPSKIIKEDEYTFNWPEDLEELLFPDENGATPGEYNTICSTYYHTCDIMEHYCAKR